MLKMALVGIAMFVLGLASGVGVMVAREPSAAEDKPKPENACERWRDSVCPDGDSCELARLWSRTVAEGDTSLLGQCAVFAPDD